jgi:hypothetical protein
MTRNTIRFEPSVGSHELIVGDIPFSESPLLGDRNLLTSRKFKFGSSEGFDHILLMSLFSPDTNDDLSDVYSRHSSQRLTESASHSGLKSVSARTRQHFVYSQHVEGMDTHSNVKRVFAAGLHLKYNFSVFDFFDVYFIYLFNSLVKNIC